MKAFPAHIPDHSYRQLLENAQRGVVVMDEESRVLFYNTALRDMLRALPRECPRERTLFSLFGMPPDDLPWDANRDFEAEDKRGYIRYLRMRALGETAAGDRPDGCWRWLAVVDVTDEERAERRNLALSRVASSLTVKGSVAETLNLVAANVAAAVGSLGCSILLLQGRRVLMVGQHGLPESYQETMKEVFQLENVEVVPLQSYRQGRPLVARHSRMALMPHVRTEQARDYLRNARWDYVCSVPLMFQGRALGSLTCYYERPREPDEELLPFLQAVADQAAVLVENARLLEELRGKAVLEERQRIARELHDSVTQALYAIGLGANTALHHLDQGNAAGLKSSLDYVASLAEAGLAEMRALIFELRPDSLQSEGLVGVLARLVSSLETRHGLQVEAELLEPALAVEAKHALYRVVQEALMNVVKHASARQVRVSMEQREGLLSLSVSDDGKGFDTSAAHPGHFGLETMRERVEGLAGRLEVESRPGEGTRIRVEVPAGETDRKPP